MDNSLKVYDLTNEDSLTSNLLLDSNTLESGSSLDPWKVCFNPKNSGQIITGQQNLQVADISKDLKIQSEIKHHKYINCMDYAPSGSLMATGDIDGAVRIFDSTSKEQKGQVFSNHGRGVRCLKFAPDSSSIISGGEDLHIYLCDVET